MIDARRRPALQPICRYIPIQVEAPRSCGQGANAAKFLTHGLTTIRAQSRKCRPCELGANATKFQLQGQANRNFSHVWMIYIPPICISRATRILSFRHVVCHMHASPNGLPITILAQVSRFALHASQLVARNRYTISSQLSLSFQ